MNTTLLKTAIRVWLMEILVSGFNFFVLMNLIYEPRWGVLVAHQIGMSTRIGYIFIFAYFLLRFVKEYETIDLVHVGFLWLGLTLLFEWGGSLAMGRPVEEILIGWNIFNGYMWPYVLLTYLSSNLIVGATLHPSKIRGNEQNASSETRKCNRKEGFRHQMKNSIEAPRPILIVVAWIAMLLTSSMAVIIWRELTLGEPYWWPWVHAIGLVTLFAITFVRASLKPLRGFILILLAIYFLGFGGGWQWGLIPFVRASSVWISWTSQAPWALSAIGTHLLRLAPALVVMLLLLLRGQKRRDFFLVKGRVDATVEPSKLLGMKKPEPWTRIGSIFATIFSIGTFTFLVLTTRPLLSAFVQALPLIPVALLIAAMNAFNEEFTLRAAPLSELWPVIGKQQALMIITAFFGLGHFYGVPNGVLGALLSGFLGWFLGKSLLETRGFFWAWLIHFLQDVFIFTFYAMLA